MGFKIVHITEAWTGGIENYVLQLCDSQLKDGNEIWLIAKNDHNIKTNLKMNIIRYSSSRGIYNTLRACNFIQKKLKEINPKVVFSHSSFPGVYNRLLKKNRKYLAIHIPHAWPFLLKDIGLIKKTLYLYIEKYLSKRCDFIVCMSLEEIKIAKKNKIKNTILIYTGLKKSNHKKVDGKQIKVKENKIKIGFLGRFDFQKGIDILFESIKTLDPKLFEFHIAGAPVRSKLEIYHAENIKYYGWLKGEKLYNFLTEIDILAIPSRWEGFSLVPIEAYRAKKAIIVSSETSLHESVIHRYNGFIMSDLSSSCLTQCIKSASQHNLEEMGENGYQVYLHSFTFDHYYEKIKELYAN